MNAGEHNHLLDFKKRITPRVCGAAVVEGQMDVIKTWFPDNAEEGHVKLRARVSAPSLATDYILACPEDLLDEARGISIEVSPAGDEGWERCVALQSAWLPVTTTRRHVIKKVVDGMPPNQRNERRQKAAARRVVIGGRKGAKWGEMTEFERSLALGTAVLCFLWRLRFRRGEGGHTFGVWLKERAREAGIHYGYGVNGKLPHIPVMLIITGGDGIFRYDGAFPNIVAANRTGILPAEASFGLRFLSFDGIWVSVAREAQAHHSQQLTLTRSPRCLRWAWRPSASLSRSTLSLSWPGTSPRALSSTLAG